MVYTVKNVFNYSKGTGASTYFLKEMKLAYGSNGEDFIKTNKKELFEAIKYDSNADMIYIRSVDTDDLWEELIDRAFIFLVQDLNTREFFAFYDKVNAMKFVVENYAREGKKENKDFNIKNFRYHL